MRLTNAIGISSLLILCVLHPEVRADDQVPGFDCSFDFGNCGWADDDTATLTWTRQKGSTPTPNTGPTSDHTQEGTDQGTFLYLEANDGALGDTAALISPDIPVLGASGACVTFWYHMHGSAMGSLTVDHRTGGGDVVSKRIVGEQGNLWLEGFVWLTTTTTTSQIIMSGEVGGNYYSDVAIDDVAIATGEVCAGQKPEAHDCDFETDFCGWSLESNTNFNWRRGSGDTFVPGTGPGADHTIGDKSGYYAYIQAYGNTEGEQAWLVSEPMTNAGQNSYCLEFWYQMFGAHVGALSVATRVGNKNTAIFRETSPRLPQWNQIYLHLTETEIYQVAFEGLRGPSYLGDIAIDDIKFTAGSCPSPYTCDFENGDCSITDGPGSTINWQIVTGNSGLEVPDVDVTYHTASGHMMFADLTAVSSPSDKAVVDTGAYAPTASDQWCFQFWYHMGSSAVGKLTVSQVTESTGVVILLRDFHSISHADEWHVWETTISPAGETKIRFEATTNDISVPTGIAVDDYKVSDSQCVQFGSCDFENGFCTWKNEENADDLDLQLHHGPTLTSDTGPDVDHTFQSAYGVYIYLDASSHMEGAVATVKSGELDSSQAQCLSYWYFMYGDGIGSLTTQLSSNSLSQPITLKTLQGNQLYGWKQLKVPIPALEGGFTSQILLTTTIGRSTLGDIAIDDIELQEDDCSAEAAPTAYNCDFETGYGMWIQADDDDFNWVLGSGASDSAGTGPGADHTLGNQAGYYTYIEASNVQPGNVAKLTSSLLDNGAETAYCMEFWYQMYGIHLGELTVYRQLLSDSSPQAIWSETEPKGPQWNPAQITMNGTEQYILTFEAVRGAEFMGDIALDDISFTPGECGTPSICDFENGDCGFTQDPSNGVQWQRMTTASTSSMVVPPYDSSYRTINGNYMFANMTNLESQTDVAIMESGAFPVSSKTSMCLQIWYYMTNSDALNLEVYQKGVVSQSSIKLREIGGIPLAEEWHVIEVTATASDDFVIVISVSSLQYPAVAGLAIDDFSLLSGECLSLGTCSFESGFCTWKNEENLDDFEWQLIQGRTPSDGTGPPYDHTLGESWGIYAYMEASSHAQFETAILKSPDLLASFPYCVGFWYYMAGETVDRLLVQTLKPFDTVGSTVMAIFRDKGEAWRHMLVEIDALGNDAVFYQVLLNASVGSEATSDIAIDDIFVVSGNCSGYTVVCDFSYGFCGWEQEDVDDEFDWKIGSGADSRYGNDEPLKDHSTDMVGGSYAYLDLRDATLAEGDRAMMYSPFYTPDFSSLACLSFWYHIDDKDVGSINAYVWPRYGNMSDTLWSISGNRADNWWYAGVTMMSEESFQALTGAV
ncbi:MAM and LDL-receptor class A domain-containing protein 1-like [Diadema antillarum]|uniref:MAM and LDL-receptor class A domain-containing protein 1-like n=1 Tax=Diadema antillarum TaxID=105358 RepID=UPI003A850300